MIEARLVVEPDGRRLVVNTFHDVSPRIESERRVRDSERRYREIADERRLAEEHAQLLADAALRLDEARDVDEAVDVAAAAPIPALADWCVIDLLQPDGSLRRVAMAARDPELAGRIEPLRDHPAIRGPGRASERAVAGRAPIYVPDVGAEAGDEDDLDAGLRAIIAETGIRSLIAQPLVARGEVIGSMIFAVGEDRTYDETDLDRTAEMARRVGPAIANTLSYAAEQRARRSAEELAARMEQLQAVTRTLAEAVTRDEVVRVVGDEARRALAADRVAIGLVEDPGAGTRRVTIAGPDRTTEAEAAVSATLASGEAAWIDDLRGSADAAVTGRNVVAGPSAEATTEASGGSACVVPLVADGTMFGALWLGFSERRQFAGDDRRLIGTFADLAAGALARIRLSGIRARLASDVEGERARLERVLRQMPIGVILAAAPDGRFVFANDAAIRLSPMAIELGAAARYDRARGHRPDGSLLRPDEWPLPRAMAGETVENEIIQIEYADASRRTFSMSAAPIADRAGAVTAAVITYSDISDRIRRQERVNFLARASEVLASSLDYEKTIQAVADLAVPTIADWCVVQMADEEGLPRRIAVAHQDPAKVAMAIQLQEDYPADPDAETGIAAILRHGRTEYVAEVPPAAVDAAARDERHREMLRALGLGSYISVPLVASGRIIGALTLVTGDSGRRLEPDDVVFAEDLATRAASAIETARLFREGVRFKRLLDATRDAVLMFDPVTGRIDYANRGAADQLGAPADELVGTHIVDHVDSPTELPLDDPAARAAAGLAHLVGSLLGGPSDTRTETLRFRTAAGATVPVEVRLQAVAAAGGEPARILAIARDIRDRIEAQERLTALATAEHARAAELNAVIRAMGEGVFVCSPDGRIILANPAAEDVFPGVGDQTYAEFLARIEDPDRRAPRLGAPGGPVELRTRSNEERWIELSTWPVWPGAETEGARANETIVMVRDVTEQRQRQAVRDTFIGVLSHELRTPVTTIYAGSKVLARSEGLSDETQREIFDDIANEAERLHRLVEDVVAMTRFGEEAGELGAEPVLLQRVLPTVVGSEEGRWPDVTFSLDVPAGLPTVVADPTYVEQVIRNLLSNAAKYGGQGTTVETKVDADLGEVRVRILDDGPGFPPEEADRLFELFFRSARTARAAAGAGIGLFVCARLIRAMGGRIWAANRPEGGSEFGFSLQVMTDED
ncbi:MAG TPA: GAF domain-containing protein [Candidatus Bathyarchaeia archaeon]|nr:GAF domain-containing protein [Candidatus Bathyarchaeia archaeon]